MLSGCELVFSARPSMYFVCMRIGSLPCHQPCSGLQGLEQKNACSKQCLRLPVLFCQCSNYLKCWGLRSSQVRRLNRSHRDREREKGQNTKVGEKEDGKRKVLKRGLGRPFSFKLMGQHKITKWKKPLHCRTHFTDFNFFFLYVYYYYI